MDIRESKVIGSAGPDFFLGPARLVGIGILLAAPARAQAVSADSIPGTLVRFELVEVPGGPVQLPGQTDSALVTPFWLGRTEVLWDAYDAFTLSRPPSPRYSPAGADAVAGPSKPYGNPDYGFGHRNFPVISVTRAAAEAFCGWLSVVTGKRYRLPTEAEWQRAADLGAPMASLAQIGDRAWHAGNAGGTTHPGGSRGADQLGVSDLFGNVAEWVTTADGRLVVRGGSWRDALTLVGPAARMNQQSSWNERDPQIPKSNWWLSDGPFVGFRIVREP